MLAAPGPDAAQQAAAAAMQALVAGAADRRDAVLRASGGELPWCEAWDGALWGSFLR